MSRTHLQRVFTTIGGLALAGTLALAQAAPVLFDVPLMGAHEVPAVQTPGQGNAALTYARRFPGRYAEPPSADCRARPRWRISMGPPLWERTRG